jgi:hypothetical protein
MQEKDKIFFPLVHIVTSMQLQLLFIMNGMLWNKKLLSEKKHRVPYMVPHFCFASCQTSDIVKCFITHSLKYYYFHFNSFVFLPPNLYNEGNLLYCKLNDLALAI